MNANDNILDAIITHNLQPLDSDCIDLSFPIHQPEPTLLKKYCNTISHLPSAVINLSI